MPRIYVLREQVLKELEASALSDEGIDRYRQSVPFSFSSDQLLDFPHEPRADAPDLIVEPSRRGRAAADFEHALLVYEWIGSLSETEARDRRLWAWMAHVPFSNYTRARWPIPDEHKEARSSVLDHWFVRGEGRASLRRHAIARLWWAVHLTRSPWDHDAALLPLRQEDPFVYTRLLLGNQDVFFHTLEREFGSDRRILVALLEVMRRSKRAPGPLVKWLAKEVNLACRYRELNALTVNELVAFMESLAALERESATSS